MILAYMICQIFNDSNGIVKKNIKNGVYQKAYTLQKKSAL